MGVWKCETQLYFFSSPPFYTYEIYDSSPLHFQNDDGRTLSLGGGKLLILGKEGPQRRAPLFFLLLQGGGKLSTKLFSISGALWGDGWFKQLQGGGRLLKAKCGFDERGGGVFSRIKWCVPGGWVWSFRYV